MELEVSLVGDQVHLTMKPADELEMAAFGRFFPQAEIVTGGQTGDTLMLQIVRIAIGRTEFQRNLRPLGLVETGGAGALQVSSIVSGEEDAKFRCLRLDPRRDPTECQNLTATDHYTAVLACELMAASNNWFGGRAEEGACLLR